MIYHLYYLFQYRRNPTSLSQGLANQSAHFLGQGNDEKGKPHGIGSVVAQLDHGFEFSGVVRYRVESGYAFPWPLKFRDSPKLHRISDCSKCKATCPGNSNGWRWPPTCFSLFSISRWRSGTSTTSVFLIHLTPENDKIVTHEMIVRSINDGFLHNSFGMRCYYFTIPLVLWLFSPLFLLVGSVLLIGALFILDHNI